MFISAFLLGNLDNTAECLVQQRQRRAQQHDEQQPGVSLGRAFGTRHLDGHRDWIHLQATWPNRNMFACSGLSLRKNRFDNDGLQLSQQKKKITKT
jgi:hypothetical protein